MPATFQFLLSISAAHLGSGRVWHAAARLWGDIPLCPPVPIPPLPNGDGFISLVEKTARLQLGFHKCI